MSNTSLERDYGLVYGKFLQVDRVHYVDPLSVLVWHHEPSCFSLSQCMRRANATIRSGLS